MQHTLLIFNGSRSLEGDTRVAVQVAKEARPEFRVKVISVEGEAAQAFTTIADLVVVVATQPHRTKVGAWLSLSSIAATSLFHCARKDTIVYTYDRTRFAEIAMLSSILARRKFIYHMNTAFMFHFRLRSRLARKARSVWSISEFVYRRAEENGIVGDHRLIRNCLTEPPSQMTKQDARAALGIPISQTAVVMVGRLSPFKGQETLIRAFADERLRDSDTHAYLVGQDSNEGLLDSPARENYFEYLQQLASELQVSNNVHFLGRRPGQIAFRAADIACVLSDEEPFGLVVAEAVASGVPLVATRSGGIPELLDDRETALLVRPRTPTEVASCILSLEASPELRAALSAEATRRVLPRVSEDRFGADVRAHLQWAVSANGAT